MDAFLLLNVSKSYLHQAPVSYLKENKIISYEDATKLDILRDLRNKSKYYGLIINLNDAKEKINEGKDLFKKIIEKIKL